MMNRDEFEKWWNNSHKYPVNGSSPYEVQGAWDAWKARQPEIDELVDALRDFLDNGYSVTRSEKINTILAKYPEAES
jgi:hypothetical protein